MYLDHCVQNVNLCFLTRLGGLQFSMLVCIPRFVCLYVDKDRTIRALVAEFEWAYKTLKGETLLKRAHLFIQWAV